MIFSDNTDYHMSTNKLDEYIELHHRISTKTKPAIMSLHEAAMRNNVPSVYPYFPTHRTDSTFYLSVFADKKESYCRYTHS